MLSLDDAGIAEHLSIQMIAARRFSAHGRGKQIIVEVGIDPASYVNEQYQRRVRAPSEPRRVSVHRRWPGRLARLVRARLLAGLRGTGARGR